MESRDKRKGYLVLTTDFGNRFFDTLEEAEQEARRLCGEKLEPGELPPYNPIYVIEAAQFCGHFRTISD